MEKNSRIFVAGHRGLVGSAIRRGLERQGYTNLLLKTNRAYALAKIAGIEMCTGTPRREFLYSEDVAEGCIYLMNLGDPVYDRLLGQDAAPLINVGSGQDQTIRETAELVMDVLNFKGDLVFDTSRPDGTPRKLLDVSKINSLGWHAATSLAEGIRKTCDSMRGQLKSLPT